MAAITRLPNLPAEITMCFDLANSGLNVRGLTKYQIIMLWLEKTVSGNKFLLSSHEAVQFGLSQDWIGVVTSNDPKHWTYEIINPASGLPTRASNINVPPTSHK